MIQQRFDVDLPSLLILDMAGTTVRDSGEVPAAFLATLEAHGVSLDAEQLTGWRGASKRHVIEQLLPDGPDKDERVQAVYSRFREELRIRYAKGVLPVDGAEATMRWFRERETKVVLNTGFDRVIVDPLLQSLGWRSGVVDHVVTADTVPRGRPAPDMLFEAMKRCSVTDASAVAAVGDTVLDLKAGEEARVRWNVGVLSGAHDHAMLSGTPHTHLLQSVAELPSLWIQ